MSEPDYWLLIVDRANVKDENPLDQIVRRLLRYAQEREAAAYQKIETLIAASRRWLHAEQAWDADNPLPMVCDPATCGVDHEGWNNEYDAARLHFAAAVAALPPPPRLEPGDA